VPLAKMMRHWEAALTWLGSTLPFNDAWMPNPPGSQTVTFDGPSSEFPIWEDVFLGR